MATVINLEKDVKDLLSKYSQDVEKSTVEIIKEVAKEAAKKLRDTSPRKTGKYAKGWTSKVEKERITSTAIVYGKKDTYPLAHLLEHGHAKKGGGRVAPIPHIKPVEEWVIQETEKRLIKAVGS